jgi:hypothetical protein
MLHVYIEKIFEHLAHYHDMTCIDLKSSLNSEIGIIRSG